MDRSASHNHRSSAGCHRCGFVPQEWPNLEKKRSAGRPKGKAQTSEEKNVKRRSRRRGTRLVLST